MKAFNQAWSVLKNAPVPAYAQPSTMASLPFTTPATRSAMEDEDERERYSSNRSTSTNTPYGIAERMPRPDVGSGESSFDSERMNTGSSVFNPKPSWQRDAQAQNPQPQYGKMPQPQNPQGNPNFSHQLPIPRSAAMGAAAMNMGGNVGIQQQAPNPQPKPQE